MRCMGAVQVPFGVPRVRVGKAAAGTFTIKAMKAGKAAAGTFKIKAMNRKMLRTRLLEILQLVRVRLAN